MLDRVRLGYELWRQFNGFPPQLPTKEMFQDKPLHHAHDEGKK